MKYSEKSYLPGKYDKPQRTLSTQRVYSLLCTLYLTSTNFFTSVNATADNHTEDGPGTAPMDRRLANSNCPCALKPRGGAVPCGGSEIFCRPVGIKNPEVASLSARSCCRLVISKNRKNRGSIVWHRNLCDKQNRIWKGCVRPGWAAPALARISQGRMAQKRRSAIRTVPGRVSRIITSMGCDKRRYRDFPGHSTENTCQDITGSSLSMSNKLL
jgi:hypothetical protein